MKTIRFGILMFSILASAMSIAAARGGKKPNTADSEAAKIEEWKREVKKLEAAPVAEGFVKWTGLDTIKGTKNARWLSPSDLRGRFVVIVELDKEKVVEQFKAAFQLQGLGFAPEWNRDWEFSPINRDVVVVYNVHDLSDEDFDKQICGNDAIKKLPIGPGWLVFYGNITFEGAPDSATERPYVYVMAPEGKEPIYKSRIKTQCFREAKEAIAKTAAELPAWRPWYGYVEEVKYTKGFDAAVSGGKGLAPFLQVLKKGIVSKKQEVAAESQRLFDALEQRKADLLWQIKKESSLGGPCAALYDMDELTKRFPASKREMAAYSERIAKAHPNIATVYKAYSLYRRCSEPGFKVKSTSEAKKMAAELEKARPALTRLSNDANDVTVQNVASSLLAHLDDIIAELPEKVMKK